MSVQPITQGGTQRSELGALLAGTVRAVVDAQDVLDDHARQLHRSTRQRSWGLSSCRPCEESTYALEESRYPPGESRYPLGESTCTPR